MSSTYTDPQASHPKAITFKRWRHKSKGKKRACSPYTPAEFDPRNWNYVWDAWIELRVDQVDHVFGREPGMQH